MHVQILNPDRVVVNGVRQSWEGFERLLSQLAPGGYEICQGKGKYFTLSAQLIDFCRLQRRRRTSFTIENIL